MADEQFHFANNKWDVTKNNNNKNKKTRENKHVDTSKNTAYSGLLESKDKISNDVNYVHIIANMCT